MNKFKDLDRAEKACVVQNLKEFRRSLPGGVLLELIEKKRSEHTQRCVEACTASGEHAEHLRVNGIKSAAILEFIKEIFDDESFRVRV